MPTPPNHKITIYQPHKHQPLTPNSPSISNTPSPNPLTNKILVTISKKHATHSRHLKQSVMASNPENSRKRGDVKVREFKVDSYQ